MNGTSNLFSRFIAAASHVFKFPVWRQSYYLVLIRADKLEKLFGAGKDVKKNETDN